MELMKSFIILEQCEITWNIALDLERGAKKSAINGHCSRTATGQTRVKNPSKLKLSPIRLRCKQRNGKAAEISPLAHSQICLKIFFASYISFINLFNYHFLGLSKDVCNSFLPKVKKKRN